MNVLIVGLPHSGTTLLRRIIGSHPCVCENHIESLPLEIPTDSIQLYKFPVDTSNKLTQVQNCRKITKIIHIQRDINESLSSICRRFPGIAYNSSDLEEKTGICQTLSRISNYSFDYESLIESPSFIIQQICSYIGIQYDEKMPSFHETPCYITNSGNVLQIPIEKPHDTDHELLRLWQINQPLSMRQSNLF